MALEVANKSAELMDILRTLRAYILEGKDIKQATWHTERVRADDAGQWPQQTCGHGDSKDAEWNEKGTRTSGGRGGAGQETEGLRGAVCPAFFLFFCFVSFACYMLQEMLWGEKKDLQIP